MFPTARCVERRGIKLGYLPEILLRPRNDSRAHSTVSVEIATQTASFLLLRSVPP